MTDVSAYTIRTFLAHAQKHFVSKQLEVSRQLTVDCRKWNSMATGSYHIFFLRNIKHFSGPFCNSLMTHSDLYYKIYSGIPLNILCFYFDTYIIYIYPIR